MKFLSEFSQIIPLYKQEGTQVSNFPYLFVGLISSILCFLFKTILNYLDRQSYYEKQPPEDILEIIREIDNEAKKKESTDEKKESLETRVSNAFLKSQLYGQDRSHYSMVKSTFMNVEDMILTLSGFLPFLYDVSKQIMSYVHLENSESAVSITCVVLQSIFEVLVTTPWSYYYDFVIEEKHGFNKQTTKIFVTDLIKEFLINNLLMIPLYLVLIFVLHRAGPNAYLYCWLFFILFSIILNMIYPIFIMPLFNKMTPMEDTPLRARIYKIAEKVGFHVNRIQVIDSSQRTGHSNAAAYGLFGVNGILIYDNLLTQLTDDEIIAVICHELGHWKYSHVYKTLFTNAIYMFLLFKTFSFFVFNPNMYASYGFNDMAIIIGLTIFLSSIWDQISMLSNIAMNALSRAHEYQADAFATELGYGHHLQVALTKLEVENSMSFKTHWLVSLCRHDHPSFAERCEEINKLEKKMK